MTLSPESYASFVANGVTSSNFCYYVTFDDPDSCAATQDNWLTMVRVNPHSHLPHPPSLDF